MSDYLKVWIESDSGPNVRNHVHAAECTLRFNDRVIFGPRHCHDNTIRLRDALALADPRFQLTVSRSRPSFATHTYSISVQAGGNLYLGHLSTHENMVELCKAINDTLAAERAAEAEHAARREGERDMERVWRSIERNIVREREEHEPIERESQLPPTPQKRSDSEIQLSPPQLPPQSPEPRPAGRQDFEIAIICALKVEFDAVEALLDEDFEADGFSYGKAHGDFNAYTIGRIGQKAIVMAYMPNMGKVSSAIVATQLCMSFRGIRVAFLVGICGAAPRNKTGENIFLGDIIVGTAVVQTDFGRQHPDVFIRKDTLEDNFGRGDREIRSFLQKLEGKRVTRLLEIKTLCTLVESVIIMGNSGSAYPSEENDHLYRSDYRHKHQNEHSCQICASCNGPNDPVCEVARISTCSQLGCDSVGIVTRRKEGTDWPRILDDTKGRIRTGPRLHFGRFASADTVMKSGVHRDNIIAKENVIAFEMEGAGAWDSVPTVIIKSACDYADSHKSKVWQSYAAMTAAACAKAILEEWRNIIV